MRETKRKGLTLLFIAVGLAVLTFFLLFIYLSRLEQEIGEQQRVVVAATDIPARSLLTADLLRIKQVPRKYVHDASILSINDVISNTVALVDISEGQILQRNMLDTNAGLQPQMRAVAVAVDQVTSVGGNVRPGNRVDILVSYQNTEGQGRTEVLLQDIEILAVNSLLPKGPDVIAPNRFLPTGEILKDATVTLSLNLEDAQKLTYMANFGKEIRLVIRRPDETGIQQLNPVTTESFR